MVVSTVISCASPLHAEPNTPSPEITPFDAVQKGNRLYTSGDYQQALQTYESAQPTEPDAPILIYNRANSHYRLEQFDRALELYSQVSAQSKDISLVTKAKFNLGNAHYSKALSMLETPADNPPELQSVLDELVAAVKYYRQVLDLNPDDPDATRNLAVTRLRMKDILDRIKQQAEQQQRQQQNQELAEKIKKLLERQIETLKQTAALPPDVPPGPTTEAAQLQAECAKLSPQQQQLSDDTAAVRDEVDQMLDQTPPPPANPDPCTVDPAQMDRMAKQTVSTELTNATQSQDNAVDRLDSLEVTPAIESEAAAAEHLKRALEALGQPQQQDQPQQSDQDQQQQDEQSQQDQQSEQPQDSQDQQDQPQPDEAEQQAAQIPDTTAQEILDKEKERNEQRRAIQLRGYQTVEKDW